MLKREAKDPQCPRIEMICISDGRRVSKIDDGHAKGNPMRPNGQRQIIEALLKKTSPLDGEPLFVLAEQPKPFSVNGVPMSPIKGDVYKINPKHYDERIENHTAERKAQLSGVRPAPSPTRAALSSALAESESKKERAELKSAGSAKAKPAEKAEA